MAIKKDDFAEIEYTGRLKENNEVFDTTNEQTAKDEEIYNPNVTYGPVIICVGEGQIVQGLDEALIGKEPGKHKIDLSPEQAFGKKDAKLIQMVPLNKFTQNDIKPFPGLQVNIDNAIGTVKTVSGGRVLVDFNHPLSGKELIYEIDVKRMVTDKKEQIEALLKLFIGIKEITATIDGDKAKVELPANVPPQIAKEIKKKVSGLIKISDMEFIDSRKTETKDSKLAKQSAAKAKKPEPEKKPEKTSKEADSKEKTDSAENKIK